MLRQNGGPAVPTGLAGTHPRTAILVCYWNARFWERRGADRPHFGHFPLRPRNRGAAISAFLAGAGAELRQVLCKVVEH